MTVWQKIVDIPDFLTSKNAWRLAIGIGIAGCLLVAGGAFWWYHRYQQEQASFAFVGALDDTERALRSATPSHETIGELEQAFLVGANRYASTSLAPFFEAFGSEMEIRNGALAEALTTLQRAVAKMPLSSPYYYLYATKVALVQLDSSDEAVRAQGYKALQELAQLDKNPQRDMARYYLGLHEWSAGNHLGAKDIWSSLETKTEKPSAWARLAQTKLAVLPQ